MIFVDWLVVAAYFAVLAGVAVWVVRQKQDSSAEYFLAGRNLGWFVVGASLFASNIGSEHLVGLAGAGASSGVAMAHYELHAWCLLVLGWVMVPFYLRSAVYTMPEFLERAILPQPDGSFRWSASLPMCSPKLPWDCSPAASSCKSFSRNNSCRESTISGSGQSALSW